MKRRASGLLVLALAAAVLPWANATASVTTPSSTVAVARYTFASKASGLLVVRGSVRLSSDAILVLADVDVTNPRSPRVVQSALLDLARHTGVRTFGPAGEHQLCPPPIQCREAHGRFTFELSYTISGDEKRPLHFLQYVAVRGVDPRIRDTSLLGWHATHWVGGLISRTDSQANGAGIASGGNEIGAMTGVAATGPSPGSVAILAADCDVIGAGAMVLTGGSTRGTVTCPADTVGAFARGPTEWRATGLTIGAGSHETRLAVIRA